jgi:hypothetical protein
MSMTAGEAFGVLRALIEANTPAAVTARRWQNERLDSNGVAALPDIAATFIYSEFLADRSSAIEKSGGRGSIRYRNPAMLEIFVLVPKGTGLVNNGGTGALQLAEVLAAVFRGYSLAGLSVKSATAYPGGDGAALKPKGIDSGVDRYFWAAVEIELYFDLIG